MLTASRYRYDWKEVESRKNILRTHTTAISSRLLYKLAQARTLPTSLSFFVCPLPRVPFKVRSRSVDSDLRWPQYLLSLSLSLW
jgi:hypothetical protein